MNHPIYRRADDSTVPMLRPCFCSIDSDVAVDEVEGYFEKRMLQKPLRFEDEKAITHSNERKRTQECER
jgi:hypothetical protein